MRMKLSGMTAEKGNTTSSSVVDNPNRTSPANNTFNVDSRGLNYPSTGGIDVRSGSGHDGTDYVIVHSDNHGRCVSNEVGDPEVEDLQSRMSMTSLEESPNHSQPFASNGAQNGGCLSENGSASMDSSAFQSNHRPPVGDGESDAGCPPVGASLLASPSMFENVRRGYVLKTADAQTKDSFNKLCGVFSQVDALFALTRKFDQKPSPEQLAGIIFSRKSSSCEEYTNFVSYYESLIHVFPIEEFQEEIVQTYLTEDPSDAAHFLKTLFLRIDSRND